MYKGGGGGARNDEHIMSRSSQESARRKPNSRVTSSFCGERISNIFLSCMQWRQLYHVRVSLSPIFVMLVVFREVGHSVERSLGFAYSSISFRLNKRDFIVGHQLGKRVKLSFTMQKNSVNFKSVFYFDILSLFNTNNLN